MYTTTQENSYFLYINLSFQYLGNTCHCGLYIAKHICSNTAAKSYNASIIAQGEYWQKVYLKELVEKYLANAVLNKTICDCPSKNRPCSHQN